MTFASIYQFIMLICSSVYLQISNVRHRVVFLHPFALIGLCCLQVDYQEKLGNSLKISACPLMVKVTVEQAWSRVQGVVDIF